MTLSIKDIFEFVINVDLIKVSIFLICIIATIFVLDTLRVLLTGIPYILRPIPKLGKSIGLKFLSMGRLICNFFKDLKLFSGSAMD